MNRRPILAGAATGLLFSLVLAPVTGVALGELSAARAQRDKLAAMLQLPDRAVALLPPALVYRGGDSIDAVRSKIERLARGGGVLVEAVEPRPAPVPLFAVSVRLSGPEKAVVAMVDTMQRERPLLRFRRWQWVPAEGGGVRFTGEVVGVAQ